MMMVLVGLVGVPDAWVAFSDRDGWRERFLMNLTQRNVYTWQS